MYIEACNVHCMPYWPTRPWILVDGLVLWTCFSKYSIRYLRLVVIMLLQNYIYLKDSRISPCKCRKNDFGSKSVRTGGPLHGATSNRDNMWHSPVFTCISPNRIPMKTIVLLPFGGEMYCSDCFIGGNWERSAVNGFVVFQ
jgi:hypothetical protein